MLMVSDGERDETEDGQVSCTEILADKDDRVDNVGGF